MSSLALADIQGFVLFAYGKQRYACYLHVTFPAAGRPSAWLAEFRHDVCNSTSKVQDHDTRVNVAFTADGLGRLGLGAEEMKTFPREYTQGMGDDLRTVVTGDDPSTWEFGAKNQTPIHALVLLFAKNEGELTTLRTRITGTLASFGAEIVHEDRAAFHNPQREPFGFRDGIAQPFVLGSPNAPKEPDACIATGEFLMGYPNAYSEMPEAPMGKGNYDLGKDGSYLVYRTLHQDTSGFWKWMLAHATTPDDETSATKLAASIIGRWPSGAPLLKYPDEDPGPQGLTNDFDFHDEDPKGMRCPFGAHIRRANPRDMLPPDVKESKLAVNRHRLLRRGRPYGPAPKTSAKEAAAETGTSRGLVFLALNASFRRQFEFVQQTWVNNPKFGGLSDESDPLIGTASPHFSIPGVPARRRLTGIPSFVKLRGGGYFFVPSLSALEWLSKRV